MKTSKLAALAISIGLLVGLPLGYHVSRTVSRGGRFMGHMFATAGYSSLALLQWEQADGQHAREALLGFVTFASHLDRLPDGQRDTVVLTDIGSSYLRLARLEAEDGNADLSQQYVLRAQESFKAAGRNYSQSDLMKRVSKVVESPHS